MRALIAATALLGLALLPIAPAEARGGQPKVEICHWGDSDNDNVVDDGERHTIRVAAPAVKAHLKHGDTEGACPVA